MNEKKLFNIEQSKIISIFLIFSYLLLIFLCSPIFLAFFLSSVISPSLNKLHAIFRIHYHLLIVILSLLLLSGVTIFFYIITTQGEEWAVSSYEMVKQFFMTMQNLPYLSYFVDPLQQGLLAIVTKLLLSIQQLFQYVFDILLFFIAFYFSLVECRKNRYWYFVYVPKKYRVEWQRFFHEALQIFIRYFTIELRLVIITMLLLWLGFSLLQFPHAFLKAILLAVLDCIPFFGISLVLIPLALFFAATDLFVVAISLIILLAVTIIVRQLCDAYFWAATAKIKTIHTFFISGVSFSIFGLYGIIVSPIILLIVIKWRLSTSDFHK